MSLNTSIYESPIIIADDPQNIVFGTCMLGDVYGTVESASIKRTADREEIKRCGGALLAAVLTNMRFELSLKTIFSAQISAPSLGASLVFPIAGIRGRILDISVDWEKAGSRMLSLECTSWDSLTKGDGGVGGGRGYAISYDYEGEFSID